jgi:hypothetical protein
MSKNTNDNKNDEPKSGFLTQVTESEKHKRKSLDKAKLQNLEEILKDEGNQEEDIYYYNYIEMFEDEDFDP